MQGLESEVIVYLRSNKESGDPARAHLSYESIESVIPGWEGGGLLFLRFCELLRETRRLMTMVRSSSSGREEGDGGARESVHAKVRELSIFLTERLARARTAEGMDQLFPLSYPGMYYLQCSTTTTTTTTTTPSSLYFSSSLSLYFISGYIFFCTIRI